MQKGYWRRYWHQPILKFVVILKKREAHVKHFVKKIIFLVAAPAVQIKDWIRKRTDKKSGTVEEFNYTIY